VASGAFEVDTISLADDAREFTSWSDGGLGGRTLYRSAAAVPEPAFGNLLQPGEIAPQDQRFCRRAVMGMGKLYLSRTSVSPHLGTAVHNYRCAECAVTIR
jgi:hypothetical protein